MSVLFMQPSQAAGPGHGVTVVIDRSARKVSRGANEFRLGPVEYRLLALLASEPGRVFSRAEILDGIWGATSSIDIRTIDAHIRHLRRQLGREAIRTVRGRGYGVNENLVTVY